MWSEVSRAAVECGVVLYDIDLPNENSGVLLVTIVALIAESGANEGLSGRGVTHERCVRLSHMILDHIEVERMLPGEATLEVSTPGINRRLRRPEHFFGAVGERVKVTYLLGSGHSGDEGAPVRRHRRTDRGILQEVKAEESGLMAALTVMVAPEKKGVAATQIEIAAVDVVSCRVDFDFGDKAVE